jgi:hypothetical protein
MRRQRYPVLIDTAQRRRSARFSAPANEEPALITIKLREKGWPAYHIHFDAEARAWIAAVIDWKRNLKRAA